MESSLFFGGIFLPTISLMTYSDPSGPPHMHIEEDISSQIDGYKMSFNTSQTYIKDSLLVIYNGITYFKDNDFEETGDTEFTFLEAAAFPPETGGSSLVVTYRRIPVG